MLYELDEQDFNAFLREVDLDFFYKEVLGYGQNSPPEWRDLAQHNKRRTCISNTC